MVVGAGSVVVVAGAVVVVCGGVVVVVTTTASALPAHSSSVSTANASPAAVTTPRGRALR